MTIAELRRILEQVEEQEGCGPDTVIHLNDTGSCFLEEPVLGVAMQATEPVLMIQSAHATDLARCYYRACQDSGSSLRLGHPHSARPSARHLAPNPHSSIPVVFKKR